MKTITEFSGTVLREAARLRREAGSAVAPAQTEAAEETEAPAEADAPAEAEATGEATAPEETPAAEGAPSGEAPSGEPPAWSAGLGLTGDRLTRLLEALD